MAHRADLYDIGCDGFEIIEQHFVKRGAKTYAAQKSRAPHHQPIMHRRPLVYQPQESLVYQSTRVSYSDATVTTSHETSVLQDGPVFMDLTRRRPTRMTF
ncbi:hypothetical protein C2S52_014451 [Perilla frutescens var. hirtella]|nr:hypothetical protein C2S52_014451 [Perilla frutescens var. hirtella]KAH6816690.1 hypothetical protein C2S51_021510 [Perilla frutescens var. frutescens]